MSTFALIPVEALSPGEADEEYVRGWRLAETLIAMRYPTNSPSPDNLVTETAAEGYRDRMLIHEHEEFSEYA
jgi:hypothetical protein